MNANLAIPSLTCPAHPKELIIRASLQRESKQLLFCHQCLENNKQSDLVKLYDLLPLLQKQYQESSSKLNDVALPPEAEALTTNQKEIQMQFSEQIHNNKHKADEEVRKIQTEVIKLLQDVNISVGEKLDKFGSSFNKMYEDFNKSVQTHQETLAESSKATPSQQDLKDKIFNTESSQEAEKNLREVLKSLKLRKDIKDGTAIKNLTQLKDLLKKESESAFETKEKSLEKYMNGLKILQTYLEASLYESSENQDTGKAQEKESVKELVESFGKLNKILEESNSQIEAIFNDRFQVGQKEKKVCSLDENGYVETSGKAYKCVTCSNKYGLRSTEYACEACQSNCHKGHQVELVGDLPFICQCQFLMRECKLAVSCTVKFSGHNYIRQDNHRCTTDNMEYGNCVCTFCARNCHKGHSIDYYATGTSFCDCAELFNFCKSGNR